ncbi:ASCH domain-containing protein [Aestuariivirga sp.]|jgi:hypothetical protein|uniref:ASCH domain-containing protein n=1 Tax=Aestuariivirga sp. TaxID=2650926 RepID=UPI003782FDAA
MTVARGLIIDTPWIDHILEGRKDWEMRSQSTSVRGWIGLIRKGSGQVVGLAKLVDCGKALEQVDMIATQDHHRMPERMIRSGDVAKWVVPWKLADILALERPLPYDHKSGAVIWVTLSEDVSRQLTELIAECRSADSGPMQSPSRTVTKTVEISISRSDEAMRLRSPAAAPPTRALLDQSRRVIGRARLTLGNLNNYHFYLTNFLDAFPTDAIGGRNASEVAAKTLSIDWGGPTREITDIDRSKKLFRKRSWVRKFFAASKAREGDTIVISLTGPYEVHVRVERNLHIG